MRDVPGLAADIRQALRGASRTPEIRAVRRAFSRQLAGDPPETLLGVAELLLENADWAARVVAYELIEGHEAAFDALTETTVGRWAAPLSDWGSVDAFGVTIAGRAWREGIIANSLVKEWARSDNRWHRRLSLVATVPLNSRARGGEGDSVRTLTMCRMHLDDRDPMVVKALSWALRELAKRDAPAARRFVKESGSRLAAQPRRELTNVLTVGTKSGKPRRR